ncbi:MAG: mercuric reductase [Gemmatimonadales bacterium]
MKIEKYDAVVIGTGQGGGPLAGRMAGDGWRTAIIEREHVGGSCINVGCTPTKTMVASARVAYLARRAADYGVSTGQVTVDLEIVRRRKRQIVESFRSGSRKGLEKWDALDLFMGDASFSGERRIRVKLQGGEVRELQGDKVFVNTGARPRIPALDGLDSVPYLDSTSIMELDEAPGHLLVVGGGYIGLEFGQMFRRFGSEVTIVERSGRLLPREDSDICAAVTEIFREGGIEILVGCEPSRVTGGDGGVALMLDTPAGPKEITGSHLLIGAGRVPNSDSLNLAAAGVATDESGFIVVNDKLETTATGIYALGDVKGGPAFTHISYDDYRILRDNLLDGGNRSTANRLVPYTVFIDPQLGRVGLGEEEARTKGLNIAVAKMPMAHVARALETDESRGLMKVVVDNDTGQILGAAILGLEGGEVMSMLQIAMMGNLPYARLREAVFAHPTLAEALNNLFGKLPA